MTLLPSLASGQSLMVKRLGGTDDVKEIILYSLVPTLSVVDSGIALGIQQPETRTSLAGQCEWI
jgi:hypothetical protein